MKSFRIHSLSSPKVYKNQAKNSLTILRQKHGESILLDVDKTRVNNPDFSIVKSYLLFYFYHDTEQVLQDWCCGSMLHILLGVRLS